MNVHELEGKKTKSWRNCCLFDKRLLEDTVESREFIWNMEFHQICVTNNSEQCRAEILENSLEFTWSLWAVYVSNWIEFNIFVLLFSTDKIIQHYSITKKSSTKFDFFASFIALFMSLVSFPSILFYFLICFLVFLLFSRYYLLT